LHVLLGLHEHLASPHLTFWLPTGEWHIPIGKTTEVEFRPTRSSSASAIRESQAYDFLRLVW
jgi:hypothetical protein